MICSSQISTHCIPYFCKVSVVWSHWLNLIEERNSVATSFKVLEFGKCKPSLVRFPNSLILKILQVHLHLSLIFIGSKAANSVADTSDSSKTLVGATQLRSLSKFHNFRGCNLVATTREVMLSKSANLLQSLLKWTSCGSTFWDCNVTESLRSN